MPDVAKKSDNTTNDDKSVQDLEAEIAATAKAIGEAKTVQSKLHSPAPEAAASDEPKPPANLVKPRRSKPVVEPKKDAAIEEKPPLATKAQVIGHRQRTISPVTQNQDEDAATEPTQSEATVIKVTTDADTRPKVEPVRTDTSDASVAPTSAEVTSDEPKSTEQAAEPQQSEDVEQPEQTSNAEPTPAPSDEQSPDAEPVNSQETGQKLDAISKELDAKADAKNKPDESLQTAKIYDTKKYHVPIKPNRHHRRAAVPLWLEIIIVLVGILAAVGYAIYADIIDVDVPFLSQSQSEPTTNSVLPTTEQAVQAQAEASSPPTMALGLIDYRSSFNRGDAELVFTLNDVRYRMDGEFTIDDDANLVLDMLTDKQQVQAETQLAKDAFKNLSYAAVSAFDDQLVVDYLANPNLHARVTTGSMLGLAIALTDSSNNDMAISFSPELYSTNQACTTALQPLLTSYNQLDASDDDVRQHVSEVLDLYADLSNACLDSAAGEELPSLPLELVPEYTIELNQTDEQVVVRALDGDNQAVISLTLSNLVMQDPLAAPIVAETTPEFIATRYIDLVLLGRCDSAIFDDYTAGDNLSELAKAGNCEVIE